MKKILIILGTRPEAIKLSPIIKELNKNGIKFDILNTNQHEQLLEDFLAKNNICYRYKLSIFNKYVNLIETKANMLLQMQKQINVNEYDVIIVQGDTLSALVGAEFGFLNKISVYHVEAGMRTYDNTNPYPEETFRRAISLMATKHFCPSIKEKQYLLKEGIRAKDIYVTGNTFVDYRKQFKNNKIKEKQQILITIHRRENLKYIDEILNFIEICARENEKLDWIFPVHPNPSLLLKVNNKLSGIKNVKIIDPLSADVFYEELIASLLVITDSGGVQEECILKGKKVLVLREISERKIDYDFCMLESPKGDLKSAYNALLKKSVHDKYDNFYGIGHAAKKIVNIIKKGDVCK